MLFIRTSDYLHYLAIKRTVIVIVNLPVTVDLDRICASVCLRPAPRSRSRSL